MQPTHKIFLGTNHKPEIRGTDHAMWRRIRLVPFDVTIPEVQRDRQLFEKLKEEADGITLGRAGLPSVAEARVGSA